MKNKDLVLIGGGVLAAYIIYTKLAKGEEEKEEENAIIESFDHTNPPIFHYSSKENFDHAEPLDFTYNSKEEFENGISTLSLIDWSFSEHYGYIPVLDGDIKYAGNSSLRCRSMYANGAYSRAQHNTFSATQAQITAWVRTVNNAVAPSIGLVNYGVIRFNVSPDTWEHHRATFWYDPDTNTKWGRAEKWDGSSWVQVGGDYNFGYDAPITGALYIEGCTTRHLGDGWFNVWFDELEIYW